MPLDIDGAGRSRSLACLPAARGTVAPTRGQVPSPRDQYWSLTWWSKLWRSPPRPPRNLPNAQEGPSFQAPKFFSASQIPHRSLLQGPFRAPRASTPPESPSALLISNRRLLQTSFMLSGPSAYTNEKVLLLTKMDLTEFRS